MRRREGITQTIYLLSFVVGLGLSLFLAFVGDAHLGAHGHAGGPHHVSGHAHGSPDLGRDLLGFAVGLLSPIALAGAALLFGGAGLLLGSSALALPLAIAAGVVGAVGIGTLMRLFLGSDTRPLALTGEGAIATVNATIRPGTTGEVIYTLEGLHRSMAARSDITAVIPRGTQVVITRREGGFAWVEPLIPLESIEQESTT